MLSQLGSLVPGQRCSQLLGQGGELGGDGVVDGLGAVSGQRRAALGGLGGAVASIGGRCSSMVYRVVR